MAMFHYESEEIANICQGSHSSDTLYVAECKKTIIDGIKGSYPQLCEYEKEWLDYGKTHYEGGNPSNLEYQSVTVNPVASVENAIPFHYKRAILKGQTLVNIKGNQVTIGIVGRQVEYLVPAVKPNTRYLITYELESTSDFVVMGFLKDTSTFSSYLEDLGLKGQFILNSGDEPNYFRIGGLPSTVTTVKGLNIIEYQEGMENWDIPFFEGMQSVQMPVLTTTGKNMLNPTWKKQNWYPFKIKKGTKLTLSTKDSVPSEGGNVCFKDKNNKVVWFGIDSGATKNSITLQTDIFQINNMLRGDIEYQMEYGYATEYEPYKSNILSTNEEVELRKVGDAQDELNLLTGELTQRIGVVVLDGSEDWGLPNWDSENHLSFIYYFSGRIIGDISQGVSDKLHLQSWNDLNSKDIQGFTYGNAGNHSYVVFKINKTIVSDLITFKSWLAQNPIKIQYLNYQESIKTVALSHQIKPYEGVNHYQTSSDTIPPIAELSVPVVSTGTQTLNEILTAE